MIEQGIYFALGCIITALLALLFAPVFWRRALRLTRQRLQLQVPLSMQEILAQRDQLRAEFAVERLRLEQAMEAIQATKAEDMAEIGRRSMESATHAYEAARLDTVAREQKNDIGRLMREAAEASAENGALRIALHNEERVEGQWNGRAETAILRNVQLEAEIESHRTTIASLKIRGVGLEMRLTDAERARADAEANLRARLDTATGHVALHESASQSVRRELDDAKTHIRRLEAELKASLSEAAGNDDSDLRETIHALGVAVGKLERQAGSAESLEDGISLRPVKEGLERPLGVA